MTNTLNINFDVFGIYKLRYRIEFSCVYFPQVHHLVVIFCVYIGQIYVGTSDFERKSIFTPLYILAFLMPVIVVYECIVRAGNYIQHNIVFWISTIKSFQFRRGYCMNMVYLSSFSSLLFWGHMLLITEATMKLKPLFTEFTSCLCFICIQICYKLSLRSMSLFVIILTCFRKEIIIKMSSYWSLYNPCYCP